MIPWFSTQLQLIIAIFIWWCPFYIQLSGRTISGFLIFELRGSLVLINDPLM